MNASLDDLMVIMNWFLVAILIIPPLILVAMLEWEEDIHPHPHAH